MTPGRRASGIGELLRRSRASAASGAGSDTEDRVIDFGLTELCRTIHPRLVDTLLIWTGDDQVAKELAEETLVRAWVELPVSPSVGSPTTWCFGVARELARARGWRRLVDRRNVISLRTKHPRPGDDDHDGTTVDVATFKAALVSIPKRPRDLLTLRFVGGLSNEDTATLIGIHPGAVDAAATRALAMLREQLLLRTTAGSNEAVA